LPTFEDLLTRYADEIRKETIRYKKQNGNEINRKKRDTRPWDKNLPEIDFCENTHPRKSKNSLSEIESESKSKIETSSIESSSIEKSRIEKSEVEKTKQIEFITDKAKANLFVLSKKKIKWAIASWAFILLPTHIGIAFIPKSYYSTLYLYAPEKADSISSRLALFYNRIEFASFPMELKMPISIISRKLRQEEAQAWVIKTFFERFPTEPVLLKPESVKVEAGYITTTEILVIEGFANHPELAAKVTALYGEYFNLLLKKIAEENFAAIQVWFDETNQNIDKQIQSILGQLGPLAKQVGSSEVSNTLNNKVGENTQNLEAKRLTLTMTHNELLKAYQADDLSALQNLNDTDIQGLLKIHRELSSGPENLFYSKRAIEVEAQIKSLLDHKIRELALDLKNLNTDSKVLDYRRSENGSQLMKLSLAKQKELSFISQLNTLRVEKADLQKLKSQLDLDTSMQSSKTRMLQRPISNESSVRPQPIIYHVAAFLLITIFIALITVAHEVYTRKSVK